MTAEKRDRDAETRSVGEREMGRRADAAQLLEELRIARVELKSVGGKLRYRAPEGVLTDELRAAMRAHKTELLALLVAAPQPAAPTAAEDDPFRQVRPGDTNRIPLDELVYGDYLARHRLRIVGGTAYPDGRTFRPTLYLADDPG
jgi:hypothetical protein